MATAKNFEDLEVWQKARILTKLVYQDVSDIRDYGYRNQIQCASVSIMNNIAEGFWRGSDLEFRQFLKFSRGSAGEVKNMYYIAEDLNFLPDKICEERRDSIQGLVNGLSSFINYLHKAKY